MRDGPSLGPPAGRMVGRTNGVSKRDGVAPLREMKRPGVIPAVIRDARCLALVSAERRSSGSVESRLVKPSAARSRRARWLHVSERAKRRQTHESYLTEPLVPQILPHIERFASCPT